MSGLSKGQILGLLLLLTLLLPAGGWPVFVDIPVILLYVTATAYLIFGWISGLTRAPQAYVEGKEGITQHEDREHSK
jgi:hypothetical protein